MIEKMDHIGIAVKDINEALKIYNLALGLECSGMEEIEDQHVKTAFLPVGEVNIELVQATHPDSAVAKFIEQRGEGVHHIALKVDNIDDTLRMLKDRGVDLIDREPRMGAHGARIAFLHPKGTHGTLLELTER